MATIVLPSGTVYTSAEPMDADSAPELFPEIGEGLKAPTSTAEAIRQAIVYHNPSLPTHACRSHNTPTNVCYLTTTANANTDGESGGTLYG